MKGDTSETSRTIVTVAVEAMSSSSNLSATTTLAVVVRTQTPLSSRSSHSVASGKTIAATLSEYSRLARRFPYGSTTPGVNFLQSSLSGNVATSWRLNPGFATSALDSPFIIDEGGKT